MRPIVFVLFGATGDLACRMILPAFFGLFQKGLLPDQWRLVGSSRGHMSDDGFRKEALQALEDVGVRASEDERTRFASCLRLAESGFSVDNPGELIDVLRDLRHDIAASYDLVHFLAIPPEGFLDATRAIDAHGLSRNAKIIYEKPYGTSSENFETLDAAVHEVFDESNVFRIDHFLGKEAAQNLHIARFSNAMFASTWNRDHILSVQIDVPESLDLSDRAEFYDDTGAFLDMVVTHLFQLAAEVAMEPPASFGADDLLSARESVMDAFRPLQHEDVVFGQFDGYRDIQGIDSNSQTDTFAAVRLWVDTDRWHGVPFLLRSGKCLGQAAEQVTLIQRPVHNAPPHQPVQPGTLTFDLAGSGGIGVSMVVKEPGPRNDLVHANMHVDLAHVSRSAGLSPYERLIHDVMTGDRARFTCPDGLRYAWRAAASILQNRPKPISYARGSMGPSEADELAAPYGWMATK